MKLHNEFLNAADFRAIAQKARVSDTTVNKWIKGELNVKNETEERIIKAWLKVNEERLGNLDRQILKNCEIIQRIEKWNSILQKTKLHFKAQLKIINEGL